jgi:hypothetical protein
MVFRKNGVALLVSCKLECLFLLFLILIVLLPLSLSFWPFFYIPIQAMNNHDYSEYHSESLTPNGELRLAILFKISIHVIHPTRLRSKAFNPFDWLRHKSIIMNTTVREKHSISKMMNLLGEAQPIVFIREESKTEHLNAINPSHVIQKLFHNRT